MYRVVVINKDGTEIGEVINWTSIRFERRLNNYGTCQIIIPLSEPQLDSLIALRVYEVKIFRDNLLVWAGEQVHISGILSDTSDEIVTLTCYDYLEMFNNRYTDAVVEYASTDAGEIAWDLIDNSQNQTNGDLGITKGIIETTQNRDRTYYNQNIMEAIVNLSNVIGGFDFEFTHNKVFNVYAVKGLDRSSTHRFELGVNILSASVENDFTNPINQAISLGEGFGATQLREVVTDSSLRSTYKLRQGKLSDPDVSVNATLITKGQALIDRYGTPLVNVTFKQVPGTLPRFGTLDLGDLVTIKIDKAIWDINAIFRVYGIVIDVDERDTETIEYLVSTTF